MVQPNKLANDCFSGLRILCSLNKLPWLPKDSNLKSGSNLYFGESCSEIYLTKHYDLLEHEKSTYGCGLDT